MNSTNIEKMVKDYFDYVGLRVKRFPRCMYTVARENEQTNWAVGILDVGDGLRSKYPSEYYASNEYCTRKPDVHVDVLEHPLIYAKQHCKRKSNLGHFFSAIVIFFTILVFVIVFVLGFVWMKQNVVL